MFTILYYYNYIYNYYKACSDGPFKAEFSDDYLSLFIIFFTEIEIPKFEDLTTPSTDLCKYLIQNETLITLGEYPKCTLFNENTIQAVFGRGPTILESQEITLFPGKIKDKNCSE